MIKPIPGVATLLLVATVAAPLSAELLSDASVERYIATHQQGCVATLTEQVRNSGHTLPFGFVDNFCLCMGRAVFSSMTLAQERELKTVADGKLPDKTLMRQAQIRNECATSTTEMYASDLQDAPD